MTRAKGTSSIGTTLVLCLFDLESGPKKNVKRAAVTDLENRLNARDGYAHAPATV